MAKPKPGDSVSDVINRRQRALVIRQGYLALVRRLVLLGVISWLLLTQVFLIARTHGNEMFPAIKDGDVVLAFRLHQTYIKGDVVVYSLDSTRHIGRIVALESDVVTMDDSGIIRVNGTVQSGEIIYPTYAKEGLNYPYRVPEGHIFVLGDHRAHAIDSRDFGPVPIEQVEGKIITLLRRRGL